MWWDKKPRGPSPMEEFNMRLQHIEKTGRELSEANAELKQEKKKLEIENDVLNKGLKELGDKFAVLEKETNKRKAIFDSDSPWIEIVADGYDESKGIKIALDWNAGMIKMLKENGLDGSSDEDVIRKYIAFLYEDIVTRLEAKVDAQSDQRGKIKDYE